jgi:RNA polymerase subunit RPABC4/transcription elongation factor Spt4
MATYKTPCVHCGAFVDRDARFCPNCASRTPFGFHCPRCLKPITRNQSACSSCGRPLRVDCPACGEPTFVDERCEICGVSLMVRCLNPRCGELQFFENDKCTACGKMFKRDGGR